MLETTLGYFEGFNIDDSLIKNALHFNPNNFDNLSDVDLSKYCLVLSQYLVYYKYQYNKTKSQLMKKKRLLESTVFQLLTDDLLKKYKNKSAASNFLIASDSTLYNLNEELFSLENELILAEGLDKAVQEIINVFKKEISRREHELSTNRYERKSR